jgi:hypothetical protein
VIIGGLISDPSFCPSLGHLIVSQPAGFVDLVVRRKVLFGFEGRDLLVYLPVEVIPEPERAFLGLERLLEFFNAAQLVDLMGEPPSARKRLMTTRRSRGVTPCSNLFGRRS